MKMAADAHAKIGAAKEFTLTDLKAMQDETLFKEDHLFGNKIPSAIVSSNPLADRLLDVSDKSCLPFPFVLSPARKSLLEELLPMPEKKDYTIIEGFSQAGKSNFGCHLVLLYRMQTKKNVVMYIGDMSAFRENPAEYVLKELFYWFHEEIAGDLMIQHLILEYIKVYFGSKQETDYLELLIRKLVQIAKQKGKIIFIVVDQFNLKKDEGAAQAIFELLSSLAYPRIFISTNTDTKTKIYKRPDFGAPKVLDLNEVDNPIDVSQLAKILLKLFPNSKSDFHDRLISEMGGNLNLIFLFYNYCTTQKFLNLNENGLLLKCKEFCEEYIKENKLKHLEWVEEKQARSQATFPDFMIKLKEVMLLMNTVTSVNGYRGDLLDNRYLYAEKGLLLSINPLIQRMFQELYWSPSQIESFLNKHGSEIAGSAFGFLFEYYMIRKMQEMAKNNRSLVLNLGGGKKLNLDFNEIKKVTFGKKTAGIKEKGAPSGYDLITYDKLSSKKNVCYETPQDTFALFDVQITMFHDKNDQTSHNMINFTLHGKRFQKEKNFKRKFNDYFESYGRQAKAQLSNYF